MGVAAVAANSRGQSSYAKTSPFVPLPPPSYPCPARFHCSLSRETLFGGRSNNFTSKLIIFIFFNLVKITGVSVTARPSKSRPSDAGIWRARYELFGSGQNFGSLHFTPCIPDPASHTLLDILVRFFNF